MIQGLYSAASAIEVASINHELVAENLAHVDMPGFRRRLLAFESFHQEALSPVSPGTIPATTTSPQVSEVRTIFEPGRLDWTANRLDVALRGNGFFVLDGPNGALYTRNGTFQLNAAGQLQSGSGLPVAGVAGPIVVPPGTRDVVIREDGAVVADRVEVGRMQIVEFQDPGPLEKVGTTLYEAPAGVTPQPAVATTAEQGYRESSNVEVIDEMVLMIAGLRHYEAAQRALRTISESLELQTSPRLA